MSSATGTLALEADAELHEKISSLRLWKATPRSVTTTAPVTNNLSARAQPNVSNASAAPDLARGTRFAPLTVDATNLPDLSQLGPRSCTNPSPQLDSSLLSKLPRELRDQIWRHIVLEDIEIPIHVAHYETKEGEHRRRLQLDHPLMEVCKQIHLEVLDIYYVENTFRITDDLFSERAVRELHRLLHPWAAKMTHLEISHEFVRSEGNTAGISFAIEVCDGRISFKPHTFNAHLSTLRVDENGRIGWTSTFKEMCYCNINNIAERIEGGTVLDWLQTYVDMIVQCQNERKYYAPYCWTCACNIII